MTEFAPIPALLGGLLIGISALIMMVMLGKVAGISGIVSGLLPPKASDDKWERIAFIIGLFGAIYLLATVAGWLPQYMPVASPPALIISGILVGAGVTIGSGCTSGHGVCGLARFSRRSLVATLCFMASATITVAIIKHVLGVVR